MPAHTRPSFSRKGSRDEDRFTKSELSLRPPDFPEFLVPQNGEPKPRRISDGHEY